MHVPTQEPCPGYYIGILGNGCEERRLGLRVIAQHLITLQMKTEARRGTGLAGSLQQWEPTREMLFPAQVGRGVAWNEAGAA